MLRNRFVSVLAIAAFAGVLVTAGCGSAATKPPAAAATASARVAAAIGGTARDWVYRKDSRWLACATAKSPRITRHTASKASILARSSEHRTHPPPRTRVPHLCALHQFSVCHWPWRTLTVHVVPVPSQILLKPIFQVRRRLKPMVFAKRPVPLCGGRGPSVPGAFAENRGSRALRSKASVSTFAAPPPTGPDKPTAESHPVSSLTDLRTRQAAEFSTGLHQPVFKLPPNPWRHAGCKEH